VLSVKEPQEKSVAAIILAAGKGTRMQSELPKVLHVVAGRPMITRVISVLQQVGVGSICAVLGPDRKGFEEVLQQFPNLALCEQSERKGTADAVGAAAVCFEDQPTPPYASRKHLAGAPIKADFVLICNGDTPGIQGEDLRQFIEESLRFQADLAVLGMEVPEPKGYGRLLCDEQDQLLGIVEERDANDAEKKITLCNSGIIFCRTSLLFALLPKVEPNNSQREFYLTDIVAIAKTQNLAVRAYRSRNWQAFLGINDPLQRAEVEQLILKRESV
jgi:bifunctional UDP-N-acetylglucosamine pyrophosphorylase/glucosamine-1-phosphate N-acetyltransferase